MNKSDLATVVTATTGMPQDAALRALNASIEAITNAVGRGENVIIPGFGTFSRKHRGERKGRNPKTGGEIVIPETNVPVFKPGKKLKEAANRK